MPGRERQVGADQVRLVRDDAERREWRGLARPLLAIEALGVDRLGEVHSRARSWNMAPIIGVCPGCMLELRRHDDHKRYRVRGWPSQARNPL